MLSIMTGGWSHKVGCVCKLKSVQVENWSPPPNLPLILWKNTLFLVIFPGTYIDKTNTFLRFNLFYINMPATAPCPGFCLCCNGWVSRLRGLAEIIDIPPADLTVNQLIPWGAQGLDGKLYFPHLSSVSLFVASPPLCDTFILLSLALSLSHSSTSLQEAAAVCSPALTEHKYSEPPEQTHHSFLLPCRQMQAVKLVIYSDSLLSA